MGVPNGVGEAMLAHAYEKFDIELEQTEWGPKILGEYDELVKVREFLENAIRETNRRREKQMKYNHDNGIVPTTIKKDVRDVIEISSKVDDDKHTKRMTAKQRDEMIKRLTAEMKAAAKILEFEHAAYLRDKIEKLRSR